jgi:MarR family transcriptional regulator, organic hydroperoxide resistance regulator
MSSVQPATPPLVIPSDEMCPKDFLWLLHKASNRMRAELDRLATDVGLNDVRDWMVLAVLADGPQCTQHELGQALGVDKTTLIAILDRLEQRKLIVRTTDPADRRVRIPRITPAGRKIQSRFADAREATQARILAGFEPEQRTLLIAALSEACELKHTL